MTDLNATAGKIAKLLHDRTAARARTDAARVTDMTNFWTRGYLLAERGSTEIKVIARTLDCLRVGDWIFVRKLEHTRWSDYVYDGFNQRLLPDGTIDYDPGYCPNPTLEVIVAWSGEIADIPPDWRLCDGTKDTPDCRGYFIAGGGVGGPPQGVTFQDFTHWHEVSGGAISDDELGHTHAFPNMHVNAIGGGLAFGGIGDPTLPVAVDGPHYHAYDLVTGVGNKPHHHSLYGQSDITTITLDIRPPYLALAYIKGPADDIPPGAVVWWDATPSGVTAWERIVSGPSTTLAADLGMNDQECFLTSDLGYADLPFGGVAFIGDECVLLLRFETGNPLHATAVARGQLGTAASAHPARSSVYQPLYAPCFGSNGTPLLEQAFILGAGDLYPVGSTGGQTGYTFTSLNHNQHTHGPGSIVADIARHNHQEAYGAATGPGEIPFPFEYHFFFFPCDGGPNHTHAIYTGTDFDLYGDALGLGFVLNDDPNSEHGHTMSSPPALDIWPFTSPGNPSEWVVTTTPPSIGLIPLRRMIYPGAASNFVSVNPLPIGSILWVDEVSNIPANWQIANGTNGTRDLPNRMIVGAGGSYAVGDIGGRATLGIAHAHTVHSPTDLNAIEPNTAEFLSENSGTGHTHATSWTSTFSGGTSVINGGTDDIEEVDGPAFHQHGASYSTGFAFGGHAAQGTSGLWDPGLSQLPLYVALIPIQRMS